MVFKSIEDESSETGRKITSVFQEVNKARKSEVNFEFDKDTLNSIENDVENLKNLKSAVESGIPSLEQINTHMANASKNAVDYAKNTDIASINVEKFEKQQRQAQVELMSFDKSFKNCKSVIHGYNNSLELTGLSQKDFAESVKNSNPELYRYLTNLNGANGSFKGYIGSLARAKLGTIGLSIATTALNMAISMGLTLAIQGIIVLFDSLVTTTEEYAEQLSETSQEYSKITSKISELNSELETTKNKIDELEGKDKLTLVEENELSELRQLNNELERELKLEKAKRELTAKSLGTDFVNTVNTWKESAVSGEYGALQEASQQAIYESQKDGTIAYKNLNNVEAFARHIELYNKTQKELEELEENSELYENTEEKLGEIESYFSNVYKNIQEYKDKLEGIDYNMLSDDAKEAYDLISNLENKYLLTVGGVSNKKIVFDNVYYSDRFKTARIALEKFGNEGELTAEKISELYESNEAVKELLDYLKQLNLINFTPLSVVEQIPSIGENTKKAIVSSSFESLADQLNKIESSAEEAIETLKTLEEITEEVDNLQEAYKNLNSVVTSYNKNGFLSIDNIQTLLSLDADTIATLQVENGQLKLNTEAYKALINAKITELEISQAKNILDGVLAMSVEEAQAYANSEAYLEEASSIETLLQNQVQLALITARQKDAENNTTAYSNAVKASISQIVNLTSVYEQTRVALNENMDSVMDDTDAIKANEKALKAQKKALESQKDALEQQKEIQEKNKETLEDNKSAIEDLIDLTEDYIKQIKEDEKSALEERKEAMQEQIDAEIELLDKEKERADFEKSLAEKQNNLSKANLSLISASLDDSSVGKKNYKEAQDEYNDANSEMTEFLSEHNYDIQKEALENFKTSQEEYYDDLIDTVDEYLDDEVQLYKDACAMIDNDNGTLYNNLLSYVQTYTTKTNSEFNHMWSEAQSALQDYNDLHYSTFELMDYLQGCIYTTEAVIESYETKIENVANAINTVQSQIDDTATSINNNATAINNFNDAYKKMAEAFKGYKLKYNVNGKEQEFVSIFSDKRLAAQDIAGQISRNSKNTIEVPWYAIYGNLHKYARGTKSAVGGLSVVDEEGIGSELIPKSLGGGRYTVLPYGNPVFSKAMTNELFDFSNDPTSYLANIMPQFREQMLNNIGGIPEVKQTNVANAPNISINIQGNADASTVRALRQEADNIVKKATEASMRNIINIVDRNNFVNK